MVGEMNVLLHHVSALTIPYHPILEISYNEQERGMQSGVVRGIGSVLGHCSALTIPYHPLLEISYNEQERGMQSGVVRGTGSVLEHFSALTIPHHPFLEMGPRSVSDRERQRERCRLREAW